MRYFFIILLQLLVCNSIADGGYEPPRRLDVGYYETHLNLQYIGIEDTVQITDSKRPYNRNTTSNIGVYNVSKDSINYIFKDTVTKDITHFYFESDYIEEHKCISFNNNYNPDNDYSHRVFEFSNNRNIEKRSLSNNLIIVTTDIQKAFNTIWICDKYGNNLKKLFVIDRSWTWDFDVKNQQVRIIRQTGTKLEIKNARY